MKNAIVLFTVWGITYDMSAYRDETDFTGEVWFDVWFATNENTFQANHAARAARAAWRDAA